MTDGTEDGQDHTGEAIERVLGLEEELEASGTAARDDAGVAEARAKLHAWVDTAKAVVVTPALGRVTLVHHDGSRSSISSSKLPYVMSKPVGERLKD